MGTKIQTSLRRDSAVRFEGMFLRYEGEWTQLRPGDTYAAQRNSGPRILTVKEVRETLGDNGEYPGAVFPTERAYPYDLHECVKVSIHEGDPRTDALSVGDGSFR